ncbi:MULTISPECIES: hypothetical protein [unclassified Psychrobacillus]|uniref:hypothetical protein n=1 Tax=unclassified Psychrobacillus TaxID=2636677 RepID=UPI0030F6696B
MVKKLMGMVILLVLFTAFLIANGTGIASGAENLNGESLSIGDKLAEWAGNLTKKVIDKVFENFIG